MGRNCFQKICLIFKSWLSHCDYEKSSKITYISSKAFHMLSLYLENEIALKYVYMLVRGYLHTVG